MWTTPVPSSVLTKCVDETYQAFFPDCFAAEISKSGSYSKPTRSFAFTFLATSYSEFITDNLDSARIKKSSPTLIFTYSILSPTARATLPGNVHGVVVQTSK